MRRWSSRTAVILDAGVQRQAQAGLQARGEVVLGDAVQELARAACWWRGSVSKALIEHAPCSVLVVITR